MLWTRNALFAWLINYKCQVWWCAYDTQECHTFLWTEQNDFRWVRKSNLLWLWTWRVWQNDTIDNWDLMMLNAVKIWIKNPFSKRHNDISLNRESRLWIYHEAPVQIYTTLFHIELRMFCRANFCMKQDEKLCLLLMKFHKICYILMIEHMPCLNVIEFSRKHKFYYRIYIQWKCSSRFTFISPAREIETVTFLTWKCKMSFIITKKFSSLYLACLENFESVIQLRDILMLQF